MSANIKMQVKSCMVNLVCHFTICPNLHIYILVDNLLKKVRHGKFDPLSDRYGPVNWHNLHISMNLAQKSVT